MEDIKLLKIEYKYMILMPMEYKRLAAIIVKFDYKRIKECELSFPTNKELSIEEIKEKILQELME